MPAWKLSMTFAKHTSDIRLWSDTVFNHEKWRVTLFHFTERIFWLWIVKFLFHRDASKDKRLPLMCSRIIGTERHRKVLSNSFHLCGGSSRIHDQVLLRYYQFQLDYFFDFSRRVQNAGAKMKKILEVFITLCTNPQRLQLSIYWYWCRAEISSITKYNNYSDEWIVYYPWEWHTNWFLIP